MAEATHERSRRGIRGTRLVLGVLTALVVTMLAAPAVSTASTSAAAQPTPPKQPGMNQLGGPGPCTSERITKMTKASLLQFNSTFLPHGDGSPRTGGSCDDKHRPVIFIAHGFGGQITPNGRAYHRLIDNMVSNGYIVVYATYRIMADPNKAYPDADAGFVQAASEKDTSSRMDLDNIGFWGHSYGSSMVPWLVQQAGKRDWGAESLWMTMHSSFTSFLVGYGDIKVPKQTRAQIFAYDRDDHDALINIDIFESLKIPDSQKDFISIRSDCTGRAPKPEDAQLPDAECLHPATHGLSVDWAFGDEPLDYLDYYGVYRNYQALADCSRTGKYCNVDLGNMGRWSDGRMAVRSIVSDNPVDIGPEVADGCGEKPTGAGLTALFILLNHMPEVRDCPDLSDR